MTHKNRLRGIIYEEIGQYSLALADFDKVVELNPQHKSAANYRKEVLEILKQP